jgi:biopolymer transport protein ExbD
MRFPRNTKVFRGQLDPAPYAGVFFLLLIFLLLHSSLVFTPGIPIRLPQSLDLPGTPNPTINVAIDEDGHLYYANQVIDEGQLAEELRAFVARNTEPVTLVLQADKNARYEILVRIGLLARDAGVREALLATRPHSTPLPAGLEQ